MYSGWRPTPCRDTARYYQHSTDTHTNKRSQWRPAHYQHSEPYTIQNRRMTGPEPGQEGRHQQSGIAEISPRRSQRLHNGSAAHRRSATDPDLAAISQGGLPVPSRPLPPRRRLPPTPCQPSGLNIDQLQPSAASRSPTLPGLLLAKADLPINFPKVSASPSRSAATAALVQAGLAPFRVPRGMIPSTLPRPLAPPAAARRTLPSPAAQGWAELEEAVAPGRGTRQLPLIVQPWPGVGVGSSPSRGGRQKVSHENEEEEEDWC